VGFRLESPAMSRRRTPAISHVTASLLWALGLGLYILIGGLAIGWTRAASFVIAGVAGFGIFLFVRFYGGDEPRRP
jgi:hypothetical protein